MAGMDGLGRVFNVVPAAASLYISMEQCSAISFVCTSANSDTFAFGEAQDSAGTGAQLFADGAKGTYPTHYYEASDVDGSVAWVKHSLADDTTGAITTGHCIVVSVLSSIMDDTYDYVYVTPSATGTVIAILHDLTVQRTPANLAVPGE
jgi:hypothetical protein